MLRLKNKVTLITGAANGIGKAITILFAKEGATTIITDIDGNSGETLASKINSSGGNAYFIHSNLARKTGCQQLFDTVNSKFNSLDVLCNNVGILHPEDGTVIDVSDKALEQTIAINLKSLIWTCGHAIPLLKRSRNGSIINISSLLALIGSSNSSVAYSATKGAIISLTKSLATKYGIDRIRANVICPGTVLTEHVNTTLLQNIDITKRLERIPLKRFASPIEIAYLALFLASNESSYLTGLTIPADGGASSAYIC